ncbi:MAG TPA: non-homologous end-joining DNA ligase [Mycobacteriales bacterium]|nr:non-homologous end-joining DNA ligase [Mycobacteriales bacterium]
MSPERVETEVDGRTLSLSNLDKVLYPDAGFTKAAVIDYYAKIAPVMLPHLADRPLTLRRYPNGVDASSFFEKNVPSGAPSWVRSVTVPSVSARSSSASESVTHVVCDDRPTLVWAANLAAIELHVPLWRIGKAKELTRRPDHLVFDLDPGPGTNVVDCTQIAIWLLERLADEKVDAPVVKTSGSKGLQVYARLTSKLEWTDARDLAHEIAKAVAADHPELVVTNMRKDLREGHVLIDWSQNNAAKTTVAVYSLRARPQPSVSTPVTWDEVQACHRKGDPTRLTFLASDVLDRVDRDGDLFAPLLA